MFIRVTTLGIIESPKAESFGSRRTPPWDAGLRDIQRNLLNLCRIQRKEKSGHESKLLDGLVLPLVTQLSNTVIMIFIGIGNVMKLT